MTIDDDGVNARIIVDMKGVIPNTLPSDEVVGVGVNLYKDNSQRESDFQVFVDGGPDGWFAYLDTPNGFIDYPGTFQLGQARMVFELPWASVGDLKGSGFAAFADWSRSALVPEASEDHAPDRGHSSFSR